MHPLENVIWTALTTQQAGFAEVNQLARRFPVEIGPLTALREPSKEGFGFLADMLGPGETCALFLPGPQEPTDSCTVIATAPLLQMVQTKPSGDGKSSSALPRWAELGRDDVPEMLALTQLTKPGPFGTRTRELGTYVGIRQSGRLVAMAGERLRVPGHTEVSAVCTHPDHNGHGYAAGLMQTIMEGIRARKEIPFLHVRADNHRAVRLYERLGFTTRQLLHLAVVRKN
jgi:ribosomal protein S18 acetylase RimI-like enzyme